MELVQVESDAVYRVTVKGGGAAGGDVRKGVWVHNIGSCDR